MSIVINGIKMPEASDEMIELAILGDGTVIQTGESWRNPEDGKCYYTTTTPEKFGNAKSIPAHGRLCDLDALEADQWFLMKVVNGVNCAWTEAKQLSDVPVVIEAEGTSDAGFQHC